MNVKFNGGGRMKPLLKIFNECRILTGVGELNPLNTYWRSSLNVKFNGGGRIKPFLKIFNECSSLTGVGEVNPLNTYWRSSLNVKFNGVFEDLQWM